VVVELDHIEREILARRLSWGAYRTLLALRGAADGEGRVTLSARQVGDLVGVGERSARSHLASLEDGGLLTVERPRRGAATYQLGESS
jgi:DNA-binding transcriptional ArsR family regulator